MKIQTFSIVTGTEACDAHCDFCVSHTTGFEELPKEDALNKTNFRKAVKLATMGGCTTVLFTGKGEPTLYPAEITEYLNLFLEMGEPFPFLELQTNAIRIGQVAAKASPKEDSIDPFLTYLQDWRLMGLNTIAISTVGVDPNWNKQTYLHHRDVEYPDLANTIQTLHKLGYTVRLCVMMQKGMVDSPERLKEVIDWCRVHEVAQLTARPIRKPDDNALHVLGNNSHVDWIREHGLDKEAELRIQGFVEAKGTHIMTLMNGGHEAKVFDMMGQNICLSDCLTTEPANDDIRTLIFYRNGRLTYDWQYKGARLL